MAPFLRLGTRGSPLALAQAAEAKARLAAIAGVEDSAIEIVPIRTSGDGPSARALADEGGKGLFTKEIEEALLAGKIDLAVHSLKDMPAFLPPGLAVMASLPRADPRDALIAKEARTIAALPKGAAVGTSSPRRKAQLLHLRPDLSIVPLRGNVGTRLEKLGAGVCAATVLACAGLARLNRSDTIAAILSPQEMLPAAGQGIIAIEGRLDDLRAHSTAETIDHTETSAAAAAERALLAALDGTCRTPIAALATLDGDRLALDALVLSPDGARVERARREGAVQDAAALGAEAGAELRARARDLLP
jgi:hydroxymethylbilane synthase